MNISHSAHIIEKFENFKTDNAAVRALIKIIIDKYNLSVDDITPFSEGTNIIYHFGDKVIKLFPYFHHEQFIAECLVLNHIEGKLTLDTPKIYHTGDIQSEWFYIIMSKIEGVILEEVWPVMSHENRLTIIQELGVLIKQVHQLPVENLAEINCSWKDFIDNQISSCIENHREKHLPYNLIQQIPAYIEQVKSGLYEDKHVVLLTGEYTPMNILVTKTTDTWHITGLVDFGDAMLGNYEYDLLGPAAFLIQGDEKLLRSFLCSYGYSPDQLNTKLSHKLTALMLLHKYSNLDIQVRIKDWKNRVNSLKDLENLLWNFE